jgi:toxin YoeB
MLLSFHSGSFEEYLEWLETDKFIFKKINALLKDILRHPFSGIGKPEPLKYQNDKYWSRRITEEHRLVYQVQKDKIIIISVKGHY